MKKEEFHNIINNTSDISDRESEMLKQVVEEFPYFSAGHILLAKALLVNNSIHFEQRLKKAAAYAGDRSVLYKLLYPPKAPEPLVFDDEENDKKETTSFVEDEKTETKGLRNGALVQDAGNVLQENNAFEVVPEKEVEVKEEEVVSNHELGVAESVEEMPEAAIEYSEPEAETEKIEEVSKENLEDKVHESLEVEETLSEEGTQEEQPIHEVENNTNDKAEVGEEEREEVVTQKLPEVMDALENGKLDSIQIREENQTIVVEEPGFEEPKENEVAFGGKGEDEIQETEKATVDISQVKMSFSEWLVFVQKNKNLMKSPDEAEAGEKEVEEPSSEKDTPVQKIEVPEVKADEHLQQELKETSPLEEAPKTDVDHIIARFIKEEPRIKTPKKDFFSPVNMAQRSVSEDDIPVSETLAEIYLMQANHQKAIKVYMKLMEMYPSRKIFYEEKIKEIKKM